MKGGTAMTNTTNPINPNWSTLRTLRSLMPARVLSYAEGLQRAELQASWLLALHDITSPAVPIEIITEQPRIRIEQGYDLPASGSAHWDGHDWVITLNAAEYNLRQRYTLLHEYKHLVDHPVRHLMQAPPRSQMTSTEMAEKIADYFAACVLMPKTWIKAAFCSGRQSIEVLAEEFQVSPKAMSYRLSELGLTAPVNRCRTPTSYTISNGPPKRPTRRSYYRATSASFPASSLLRTGVLT
jgi:Zn-dependent peptidase ImmA (M78 family)